MKGITNIKRVLDNSRAQLRRIHRSPVEKSLKNNKTGRKFKVSKKYLKYRQPESPRYPWLWFVSLVVFLILIGKQLFTLLLTVALLSFLTVLFLAAYVLFGRPRKKTVYNDVKKFNHLNYYQS